jgi:hypothetical protein
MVILRRPAPAAARPPRSHPDAAALAARVAEYQRTGVLNPDLAADLSAIAVGVQARFGYGPSREDFAQDCLLHFLGWPLRRCAPGRDAVGWLTACAVGFGDRARVHRAVDEGQAAEYRADVGRSLAWRFRRGHGAAAGSAE